MLKKIENKLTMLRMSVKLYAAATMVVIIFALVITSNLGAVSAAGPVQDPSVMETNTPNSGAVISPAASVGLKQIYSYEVMYSANAFAPRIWLKNSTAYIGQLIFKPDGMVLPNDNLINGQINLYYHLQDFENTLDILRNEKPVYLLYSGSGAGFENGLRTYPETVGEGELQQYITTTYR